MIISRLFRPLDFLRIKHSQVRQYNFWIPAILAVVTGVCGFFLPSPVQIFGENGLLSIFTGLLQVLTGFYIAALAAVATFDRRGMDEVMVGTPPELAVKVSGEVEIQQLTRRRFLSLLFGYLTLLSFALFFISAFGNLLETNIHTLLSHEPQVVPYLRHSFLFVFAFLAYNLIITTMLGLYYMTDRIHREEPRLIRREPGN